MVLSPCPPVISVVACGAQFPCVHTSPAPQLSPFGLGMLKHLALSQLSLVHGFESSQLSSLQLGATSLKSAIMGFVGKPEITSSSTAAPNEYFTDFVSPAPMLSKVNSTMGSAFTILKPAELASPRASPSAFFGISSSIFTSFNAIPEVFCTAISMVVVNLSAFPASVSFTTSNFLDTEAFDSARPAFSIAFSEAPAASRSLLISSGLGFPLVSQFSTISLTLWPLGASQSSGHTL